MSADRTDSPAEPAAETPETVVVFPGQGSQKRGMARAFAEAFPESAAVFDAASEALGLDLRALCWEDDPRLDLTEFTQPAILTAEIAILRALEARWGFAPTRFAGHSLGEYTALVAAGALPLADAVRAVRERGRRMQEAVPAGEGAMAAIIRADLDPEALARAVEGLVVDLANVNGPEQIVISGRSADVDAAIPRVEAALPGVRVVKLTVSAPFHSRLMKPVEPGFREVLAGLDWRPERAVRVASNVSGTWHAGERDALVDALTAQIGAPVRWDLDMRAILALSPARIVEVGPRAPLRAFFRSVGARCEAIFNPNTARRVLGEPA